MLITDIKIETVLGKNLIFANWNLFEQRADVEFNLKQEGYVILPLSPI